MLSWLTAVLCLSLTGTQGMLNQCRSLSIPYTVQRLRRRSEAAMQQACKATQIWQSGYAAKSPFFFSCVDQLSSAEKEGSLK
jgi:hypothetical protein